MSEYESAALALAQAQLVLAQTRVGVMQAQVWVAAIVGVVQSSVLTWGLWMMRGAGQQRDAQLAQQAEQFAELVRRGDRQAEQHAQAFVQLGQTLDRQSQALEQQGQVLAELLRQRHER